MRNYLKERGATQFQIQWQTEKNNEPKELPHLQCSFGRSQIYLEVVPTKEEMVHNQPRWKQIYHNQKEKWGIFLTYKKFGQESGKTILEHALKNALGKFSKIQIFTYHRGKISGDFSPIYQEYAMNQLGKLRFQTTTLGKIRVDGGVMFGVVPFTLWSKKVKVDENHTVLLGLNPLVVQEGNTITLADTPGPAQKILDFLQSLELTPADVHYVFLSHLHWDHTYGILNERGKILFPHAKIFLQKKEWEFANNPPPRCQNDFDKDVLNALQNSPQLELLDGSTTLEGSLKATLTGGHTPGHQIAQWQDQANLIFAADLIPTTAHLRLPYISSLDIEPKTSYDAKKQLLENISPQDVIAFFHDVHIPLASIEKESGAIQPFPTSPK